MPPLTVLPATLAFNILCLLSANEPTNMPRDHFAAQTYLKHFVGPDGMLHAYRKSGGHFRCRPKAICYEVDGDIIREFLKDEALLGNFRKIFEPAWNDAITHLENRVCDAAVKLAVAGYWTNLMVCTPAWTRVGRKTLAHDSLRTVRAHDVLMTQAGEPDPKLKEMLAEFDACHYRIEAKRDAIRAMNATHLSRHAWQLYNNDWIVIRNDRNTDFITSDNPVAFDDPGPLRGGERGLPRYLTLTPRLCLYMDPRGLTDDEPDFTRPPRGTITWGSIPLHGVERVNRAVARCADRVVISSSANTAVETLVAECARFKVDVEFVDLRLRPDEFLFGNRTRVLEQ
jgi:hypothetical protein